MFFLFNFNEVSFPMKQRHLLAFVLFSRQGTIFYYKTIVFLTIYIQLRITILKFGAGFLVKGQRCFADVFN